MYTNLIDAKSHLKIEVDFTDDDNYINQLLTVSEQAVKNYLNDDLFEVQLEDIPLPIIQATYFLMANFYINRTMVSFAQGIEIPYTFQFLLNPYRNYIIK